MITGKELVEKLYSELEYEELDYLLEKAFSEGYEYAQKEFANKNENYGDIDETAPKDPRYEKLIDKLSKGAIGIGTAEVAGGIVLDKIGEKKGAKKGAEILKKVSELNKDIESAKFHMKDHFGNEGSGDFFDQQLKENRKKLGKRINKLEKEVKDLVNKGSKHIKAYKLSNRGKFMKANGAGLATIGGGAYIINNLLKNSRRTAKKDLKDVLVQSKKENNE